MGFNSLFKGLIHSAVCLKTGPQPLPIRVPTECDLVLPLSVSSTLYFS